MYPKKASVFGKKLWYDKYYRGNRFSDGHHANLSEVCCTSTNTGLKYLKQKGILETLPDNSTDIVTSPNKLPSFIPPDLKQVPIAEWSVEDTKWLNMY